MATTTQTRTRKPRTTAAERRSRRTVAEGTGDFQATHGQKPAEPKVEAEYVTRKVGPLTCRFPANTSDRFIPTIEGLAASARQVLNAKAGVYSGMPEADRRKKLVAAKPTRQAAEFAVAALQTSSGKPFDRKHAAPLVALVRKQLVTDLRDGFKAKDVADREAARQEKARSTAAAAIVKRETAKGNRTAKCAVLPAGVKPSKAVSSDQTRPVLTQALLQRNDDGSWQLTCTDSYQACSFPLTVHGDAGLFECRLSTDALKAIEKVGAFRLDAKTMQVAPVQYSNVQRSFVNPKGGTTYVGVPSATEVGTTRYAVIDEAKDGTRFPRIRDDGKKGRSKDPVLHLSPSPAPSKRMEMTFNAKLLAQMAAALGDGVGHVTIAFDADDFAKREDGVRTWSLESRKRNGLSVGSAIRVEGASGARGHLMPVRPK